MIIKPGDRLEVIDIEGQLSRWGLEYYKGRILVAEKRLSDVQIRNIDNSCFLPEYIKEAWVCKDEHSSGIYKLTVPYHCLRYPKITNTNANAVTTTTTMQLFNISVILEASVKAKENGATDTLLIAPQPHLARDQNAAMLLCGAANAATLKDAKGNLKVIVQNLG